MDDYQGLNRTNILAGNSSGLAKKHFGMPISLFLSSIYIALIACLVQITIFCCLRTCFKLVYNTRNILYPERAKTRAESKPRILSLAWLSSLFRLDHVSLEIGLDAYYFLRYQLFLLTIVGIILFFSVPILIPLNCSGNDKNHPSSAKGLDRLSWSNISSSKIDRFYAHLVVAILVSLVVCVGTRYEIVRYLDRLHHHLCCADSPSSIIQSRSALLTGFDGNVDTLQSLFESFFQRSSAITRLIPVNDMNGLWKLSRKRDSLISKIERLYTRSLLNYNCDDTSSETTTHDVDQSVEVRLSPAFLHTRVDEHINSTFVRWGSMLNHIQMEITSIKDSWPSDTTTYFVIFDSALDAKLASLGLFLDCPKTNLTLYVHPNEVKWHNIQCSYWCSTVCSLGSRLLSVLMIAGWAFPVAFISIVTQVTYLSQLVPALRWLQSMHGVVVWFLGSIGAPFLQSLFLSLVPVIFRLFATMKRPQTMSQWHLDIQRWFFVFMFVQVFLVITISSSIITTIYEAILYPTSVPKLLAADLPKAANFFASFIIIQGLTMSGSTLLRISEVLKYILRITLLTHSANDYFLRFMDFYDDLEWGSLYPTMTNLACITIVYSITSPMLLVFSAVSFICLYFTFKYRIVHCHIPTFQSFGAGYPVALFQLYTGLYCMQICMIGLFLLVRNVDGKSPCKPHSIVMTVLFAITVICHISTYRLYSKRVGCCKNTPMSDCSHKYSKPEHFSKGHSIVKRSDEFLVPDLEIDYKEHLDEILNDVFAPPICKSCSDWIWVPCNSRYGLVRLQTLLVNYQGISSVGCKFTLNNHLELSSGSPRLDHTFYALM